MGCYDERIVVIDEDLGLSGGGAQWQDGSQYLKVISVGGPCCTVRFCGFYIIPATSALRFTGECQLGKTPVSIKPSPGVWLTPHPGIFPSQVVRHLDEIDSDVGSVYYRQPSACLVKSNVAGGQRISEILPAT